MTHQEEPIAETTVTVVGLGLLGRGIVACFLGHGFRVIGLAFSAIVRARASMFPKDCKKWLSMRASTRSITEW